MKFAFAELGVRNLPISSAWYLTALGLAVEHLDEPKGFALLNDGHGQRIALKEGVPGSIRWQFEVTNLDGELARLAAAGFHPESDIQTSVEGYRRATFRDPDGNAVALFEWLPCG